VKVGIGGTSGMVTDDSETFRLDTLGSEVVGGACGITTTSYVIAWNSAVLICFATEASYHDRFVEQEEIC
jgi:hypothetical protein